MEFLPSFYTYLGIIILMSYLSSETPTQIETNTDIELRRIINDLHFVFSIFDEENGPLILYDDSPLMQEVVQSVNIMIGILLGGVSWSIYYILRMAYVEMDHGRDDLGYKTGDTKLWKVSK